MSYPPQAPQPRPPQAPSSAASLSVAGALLWLLAAAVVGVVGSLLLEGARLVAPAGLTAALLIVLPLELAIYLLALREVGQAPGGGGRVLLGVALGFTIRGALALMATLAHLSPLADEGGLAAPFLFYYARLWPAALVQVLAVGVFLWLIAELLEPQPKSRRAPEPVIPLPPAEDMDEEERHKLLLEALMEPSAEEPPPPAPSAEPEADRRPRRRRVSRRSAPDSVQARLPGAEAEAEPEPTAPSPTPPEEATVAPESPSPEDTAALPVVRDEPADDTPDAPRTLPPQD